MTLDDATEASGVLAAALAALQAAVPSRSGRLGAAFRYACGDLQAQAVALIGAGTAFTPLRACFDAAVAAGATLNGLAAVRAAVTGLTLSGQPALIVAGYSYVFALNAEGAILTAATTTYPSSGVALQALAVFSAAVRAGQDWTLDNHQSAQFQALVLLGAAVARDMQARAAPLPRLTTYSLPRGTSSLVLAYRLYGDAGRADELRAENGANHPAFMPASGSALSA